MKIQEDYFTQIEEDFKYLKDFLRKEKENLNFQEMIDKCIQNLNENSQ